ncbi:hypothetical protein ACWDRS_04315 [Streptomyces griseus]
MTRREARPDGHGGAVAKEPPVRVPVDSLLPADSARGALDEKHVQVLAALEGDFEPVLVHRPTLRVIDGMHRLSAEVLRGRQDIAVRFFDGSEADAYVLSARANVRHGLPLTLDERRTAATRILRSHPHWSDRSVAECVGLSGKTVGRLRRCATEEIPQSPTRTGRDGTVRRLVKDPSLKGSEPGRLLLRTLLATEISEQQWREIAAALPDHCAPLVRAAAARRAADWAALAGAVSRGASGAA